ncbi:MAG: NADP-dependent phosphogluconate dehydrogenase [Flavobacterium sp.]|nr:NADP-dependent phosphogluconate dehydrogenase [Pedobacter sp.]
MILIVMGVSGCGKSTVGKILAEVHNLPFFDADDFHSASSIQKMSNGVPLTDNDRLPWLKNLANLIVEWDKKDGAVLACSALKESYRKILQSVLNVTWIFLDGDRETILKRLLSRKPHYMSSSLLDSQLEALEKPVHGIHVNISLSPNEIVRVITTQLNKMESKSEFGLIGLGVMGKSLAINLASHNVNVSIYNRHIAGKEENIAVNIITENTDVKNFKGFDDLNGFLQSLAMPRKIMLMIYAGAIDSQLETLLPFLKPGDIVIDGGNSFYKDTARRQEFLGRSGIHFLGAGISGGEEGALKGASIMSGGDYAGYILVSKYLNHLSAKDKFGKPCSAFVGPHGSGHFVKMVHNGIEYAEMQTLAEIYYLLRRLLNLSAKEISAIFMDWQSSELSSYLLEITIDILKYNEDGELLLDLILDNAGQKGTGGLSVIAALEYGVAYGPLSEAVMARYISAMKDERVRAAKLYQEDNCSHNLDKVAFTESLKNAYQATKIINHEIGFNLMKQVSEQNNWKLDFSEIARIWTNGCIIRSGLMENISEIFKTNKDILTSPEIVKNMKLWKIDLANCVATGLQNGIPLPVISASLNYFLSFTTADSSANLIQAQRDYFGAHTYQRKDKESGKYYHTIWK